MRIVFSFVDIGLSSINLNIFVSIVSLDCILYFSFKYSSDFLLYKITSVISNIILAKEKTDKNA